MSSLMQPAAWWRVQRRRLRPRRRRARRGRSPALPAPDWSSSTPPAATSLVDDRYAHEDEIAALRDRLAADGLEVEIRHDVVPDVAEAVLSAAEDCSADVIVVGVRHRTPVGKLLLGSVAQRVILDAPCPVLAVKPAR